MKIILLIKVIQVWKYILIQVIQVWFQNRRSKEKRDASYREANRDELSAPVTTPPTQIAVATPPSVPITLNSPASKPVSSNGPPETTPTLL